MLVVRTWTTVASIFPMWDIGMFVDFDFLLIKPFMPSTWRYLRQWAIKPYPIFDSVVRKQCCYINFYNYSSFLPFYILLPLFYTKIIFIQAKHFMYFIELL